MILIGLAAGSVVGLLWRTAGRVRWGGLAFGLAVVVAARSAGRSDWPSWDAMTAVGALLLLLGGVGAVQLLGDPAVCWRWVAVGSLVSAAGVWAGVPETGPALLVGGALTGLAVTAGLTRSRWAPAAGAGAACVVGWAALSGAVGRPWAVIGGALCTGVAPWFALSSLFPGTARNRRPSLWLIGVHGVLVVVAARWIAVVPHAGWFRVGAVAAAGLTAAAVSRRWA